jgi:WD40 repeat protein
MEEVAVDAGGTLVLGCAPDGGAILASRDVATRTVSTGHPLSSCAFGPDGGKFATAAYDGVVTVWNTADGRELHELQLKAGERVAAFAVTFDPRGERLAIGASNGTVTVWNPVSGKVGELRAHEGMVLAVDFSPDGRQLLTGGEDNRVKIWDLVGTEPTLVREIEAHDYVVSRARFSPTGDRIATASYDGTARVWSSRTGEQLAALTAHSGEVFSLSFHPSGRLLATASADVATVWDLDSARPIARFRGHAGRVTAVAFAPDGSFLATGGDDGVIKLWDTHAEERSPEAVARAVECLLAGVRGAEAGEVLPATAGGCARVVYRVPEPGN